MSQILIDKNPNGNKILKVGAKAPNFTLKTNKGVDWSLSDHLGSVVTLLFYPQNETLVCTKQLCSVRDSWSEYLETKAVIVGVSPGTMEEHREFSEKRSLPLPLLVDEKRKVTNKFGFHWLFPTAMVRTVVVIDAKGIIRTRNVMLRAFRPSDRFIISSIYAARADALQDQYSSISRKKR